MRVTAAKEVGELQRHAAKYQISLNTVYQQVKRYAHASGLTPLRTPEKTMHAVRNSGTVQLVSQTLFDPMPPQPAQYIAACENIFQTPFFQTLKRMIHENGTGASYVQQVLDMSVQDGMALHEELRV